MRRTFHLGETNRSRRIEDKLIYMEGTAEQLLEENHRLKTELFVNGRAHEGAITLNQIFFRISLTMYGQHNCASWHTNLVTPQRRNLRKQRSR